MNKLMIVESPNKVAKISGILGDGWTVKASVGHIRDLPENAMGVEAPEFKPEYVLSERGRDVVARLKKIVATADEIYIATDPDREGEAIAWHLKEALKLKRYKRITFDAISKEVIQKAMGKARDIDMNLVRAQEGRRVLDRLVGYIVSPAISQATGIRGLTAGRVQSPAVRLVVERERQIQVFKPTDHFSAEVSFGSWTAEWDTKPYLSDEDGYILDRSLAETAASCTSFAVRASTTKTEFRAPPAPFRSATLIQAASVKLGFSPEKAMELAQRLFAAGHISYHRTDKQNYDESTNEVLRAFALGRQLPISPKVRKWPSVEGAQEGHEAIKPMDFECETAGEGAEEQALYQLIWKRAVASQLADAEFVVIHNELEANAEGRAFVFTATGRTLKSPGWMSVTDGDATEEKENEEGDKAKIATVPLLQSGGSLVAQSGKVLEKTTKAPARYTLASLVARLEKLGIGRPSTYPAILKNVSERGYIEEVKRKLHATEKGMYLVISLVQNKFSFVNFEFTSSMETELDKIASGQASYTSTVAKMHEQLAAEIQAMPAAPAAPTMATPNTAMYCCPICKAPLVRLMNRDKKYFWGCTAFRQSGCKGSAPDKKGKPDLSQISKGGSKR